MGYEFLESLERGKFFPKKEYKREQNYIYEEAREKIPEPVLEGKREWTDCYDYAVKLLFDNIHQPKTGSGFVSDFVDAAFNEDIFLWDTVFITLFCNVLHPYVPGICSLDNFYCRQFDDGEIPREMVRDTGKDFLPWVNGFQKPLYSYFHNHYGHRKLKSQRPLCYEEVYKPDLGREVEPYPYLTLDNLNHPLLAFAEWESFCHTGDRERLSAVVEPLYQYYQAFKYHLRHKSGLYVTDWASMDNSPRNRELGLAVDTSCEMVLFGRNLLSIMAAAASDDRKLAQRKNEIENDIASLKTLINEMMWDEESGFYYDLTMDGKPIRIKTAAAFWALISGVAEERQAERLAGWLEDEKTFNRLHRVPCVAADEPEYDPMGGYWRGSVWAPINAMVVLGLERCGRHELAKKIALNHLDCIVKIWKMTGSIWENYPPDFLSSGNADKKDFVGWSGLAPVLYLIQYGIGISINQKTGDLIWELEPEYLEQGAVGCWRYWFRGKTVSLCARKEKGVVKVSASGEKAFRLHIRMGTREVIKDVPEKSEIRFTV
ncbi:alpha,alpha-trehalase [Clostridium sp. MCC353]|uniref:MGH1-like glycoside hydrolase domain-containing protein n=1 Tax=Clostridium sp. MCC353 TaxID=2592646 RepID=UPI001C0294CC|nr:trehalase family glycosidase [Clostridium sp. MCC353]MBT9776725.1 alpha,alpha-trehalase [Clostridium sp. MCC353]